LRFPLRGFQPSSPLELDELFELELFEEFEELLEFELLEEFAELLELELLEEFEELLELELLEEFAELLELELLEELDELFELELSEEFEELSELELPATRVSFSAGCAASGCVMTASGGTAAWTAWPLSRAAPASAAIVTNFIVMGFSF
jgi:hypothetical protein